MGLRILAEAGDGVRSLSVNLESEFYHDVSFLAAR